ncbi:MAG: glycosyltransferase [Verrucomicrobia bacterium]|nr:glycosyltransferase [Verrucomicrobiota bacterium]
MVSIIIPLKRDQGYLARCVEACRKQEGAEIEIIALPDDPLPSSAPGIRVEPTGPALPARKRNRGGQLSKGDVLAFIDDDTRPRPGWIRAALVHFQDPGVAAVGGPSITPPEDLFWAQVSGAVYESWMMSGGERRRYQPGKPCDVEDFPSCNLLVRRSAFEDVGGFGADLWPGEDTAFCLALVKKGFRIRYEPQAVIEHHRRPSLMRHFVQLANYGLHRGYFAKRYPETSRRIQYFLPTLFVLIGSVATLLALAGNGFCRWALAILAPLYFLLMVSSLVGKPLRLLLPSVGVIFVSHLAYGISFVRGLMARRLPEEAPPPI